MFFSTILLSAAVAAQPVERAYAGESDALGFSHADVGKAAWAYITDLSLPSTKRDTAVQACRDNLEFFWAGNRPISPPETAPEEEQANAVAQRPALNRR